MPKSTDFQMPFESLTIDHLGFKLYSTLSPVLNELVTNAYDAEATQVRITIPNGKIKPSSEVIIRDNGLGMSESQLREAYLPIGRCRRGTKANNTKSETGRQWCEARRYPALDASNEQSATSKDPLHNVPYYPAERYRLIADIPKHSGKSAYDNCTCPNCDRAVGPKDRAKCSHCGGVLWNRPIVRGRGRPRLIRGFLSSYRRMRSDRPAATITTNSSHVGSDWKIHPYENRVLSARECADLQTVPRWYSWKVALKGRQKYLVRNLIGEALPPYFTYLHGHALASLLRTGKVQPGRWLTPGD